MNIDKKKLCLLLLAFSVEFMTCSELSEAYRLVNNSEGAVSNPFPAASPVSELERLDSQSTFWDRDMSSLLAEDANLRESIGAVFCNADRAGKMLLTAYISREHAVPCADSIFLTKHH